MPNCQFCHTTNQPNAKFCASCGQRLTNTNPPVLLQGRYQIMRQLGQGGMGAVYQAQDLRLGKRLVAVKENFDPSSDAQQQFQLEANVLANLSHPALPRVIDHFVEPSGKQYLVMDFVEGEDLQEMLDRGVLRESQVLGWFDQICDALEYLHAQQPPIIHRDLKPANIRVRRSDGKAMLVDFGIAKVQQASLQTVAAARAVTPGFSPPEQYGQARTNSRSDIYSLGATLYALLTGQAPPDAMDRFSGTPLPLPRHWNRGISATTETAMLQALELNPAQRPQTVAEFRRLLKGPTQIFNVTPTQAQAAAHLPPASTLPIQSPVPAPLVNRSVGPSPTNPPAPLASAPAIPLSQIAGLDRRFVAFFIDIVLTSILQAFVLIGIGILVGPSNSSSSDTLNCLASLVSIGTPLCYYTFFHAHSGQTPGKKILGIKVVRTDGSPLTTSRAILRLIGAMIGALPLYLGYLWAFTVPERQTWHDKIADTYVIKV
jgi:serine/threonine protein kinase